MTIGTRATLRPDGLLHTADPIDLFLPSTSFLLIPVLSLPLCKYGYHHHSRI